jgi:hypothetical protein
VLAADRGAVTPAAACSAVPPTGDELLLVFLLLVAFGEMDEVELLMGPLGDRPVVVLGEAVGGSSGPGEDQAGDPQDQGDDAKPDGSETPPTISLNAPRHLLPPRRSRMERTPGRTHSTTETAAIPQRQKLLVPQQ